MFKPFRGEVVDGVVNNVSKVLLSLPIHEEPFRFLCKERRSI